MQGVQLVLRLSSMVWRFGGSCAEPSCSRSAFPAAARRRGGGNWRALGLVGRFFLSLGIPSLAPSGFLVALPSRAPLHLHESTGVLRSAARFGAVACSEESAGLINRPKPRNCRALLQNLSQRSAYSFALTSFCLMSLCSFNQRFSHAAHDRYPQCCQPVWIIGSYDMARRQHRVVRSNVCGIFRRLLNGFHLFFAACVVEGTDDDWLAEKNVSRGAHLGLLLSVYNIPF
jgi:hypothetical protein